MFECRSQAQLLVQHCKPQAEEDWPLIFGPGPWSLTRITKGSDLFLTLVAAPSTEQRVFPSWVWPVHTSITHTGVPSSHLSNADQNPLCVKRKKTPDWHPAHTEHNFKSRMRDFKRGIPCPQAAASWRSIWTCAMHIGAVVTSGTQTEWKDLFILHSCSQPLELAGASVCPTTAQQADKDLHITCCAAVTTDTVRVKATV